MPTDEEFEALTTKLAQATQERDAAKTAHSALTTAHTSLTAEHETSKANLSTSQSELKTASDANKSSTKSLEDSQKQLGERDAVITTHAEAVTAHELLKTEHGTLLEANLTSQKERLKAAGIGDELLKDKDSASLSAMEATVAAVTKAIPGGTQTNPSSNGLAGGGDNNTPALATGLDIEIDEIKAAKARAGIK